MKPEISVDNYAYVAGASLLVNVNSVITIKYASLTLNVRFHEVKEATENALHTEKVSKKVMDMDVEVLREHTGGTPKFLPLSGNDKITTYIMFRTSMAHNEQVEFAYNFYVQSNEDSSKQESKKQTKKKAQVGAKNGK